MDLDKASQAHGEWKVKLRLAISKKDKLDADTIGKDNCCALGQWLHGSGRSTYGRLSAYSDCVSRHAVFHKEASAVARVINAGDYAKAESMLAAGTPYAAASGAVTSAILGLKKAVSLAA